MNALLGLYAREPAVILSGCGALVSAVIVLLVSFGVPITDAQKAAINTLVILGITIGASFLVRTPVTPVAAPAVADLPPH